MEDRNNIQQIYNKKVELYLLYGQTMNLHKLYYQDFGEKKVKDIKEKYYLIDKKWLDNYKIQNNFDLIKADAEKYGYQYDDYETFKSKIINRFQTNPQKKSLKIEPTKLEPEILSDYKILLPKNFFLVKREVFDSSFLNYDSLYDVVIGEKNIFIFDKQVEESTTRNIFICSIQFNEKNDDITDFCVNADYILIFDKEFAPSENKNFFNCIKSGKGVKNYIKTKKLNNKGYGVKDILGNYARNVGKFYNLKNNNKIDKDDEMTNHFSIEYLKKVYPNDFKNTVVILNNSGPKHIEINHESNKLSLRNVSKCITIYGNLYYYLNDNNKKDNCTISEYIRNINQ